MTVEHYSNPLEKAIEWEYQSVVESQRIDYYALLLEPTEFNYERARSRYLKKKKQKVELLDKITYVDRFYDHQLPNEIVPNNIRELRQVLALAPTIQDNMPRQVIQLLQPYRFHLETYQQMGIRSAEIAPLLEEVYRLEEALHNYQATEAYQTNAIAQRTIDSAYLQEPQAEAVIRKALEEKEGGTIHLVHLLGNWTAVEQRVGMEWQNYGQATMTSGDGTCYLVYFDVQKADQQSSSIPFTVKPYKYDPIHCEKATQIPTAPTTK